MVRERARLFSGDARAFCSPSLWRFFFQVTFDERARWVTERNDDRRALLGKVTAILLGKARASPTPC